jgi:hypothetical protein
MPKSSQGSGSPTAKLLVGLVLTLAAVLLFAYYMTGQLTGLRALQSNLVDRNRKDSLQLLRVQNDLNSLALAMRDMLDAREPYPLTAWTAQFERIRGDLDTALKIEPVAGAILGCDGPDVCAGGNWKRKGSTGSDSSDAAGAAGSAEHGGIATAGAEQ